MSKFLLALLAALVIGVEFAGADPLSDAKEQISTSSYLEAQASLEAAYASGQNGPEQLAEVWRLQASSRARWKMPPQRPTPLDAAWR